MDTFESLEFYRGVSNNYLIDRPSILKPRRDRRPKDASLSFHSAADDWFFRRFGVKYRSTALFVTSRRLTAQAYAASPEHVMRVVPLSKYQFCWSPKVSDLLFKAKELAGASAASIHQFLDSAQYQETALDAAHGSGHELMLYCEQYVAIPVDRVEPADMSQAKKILLPFSP